MPRVTLHYSDGRTSTSSGGCFGFCGRGSTSGSFRTVSTNYTITSFEFHLGQYFENRSNIDSFDIMGIVNKMATDSPWAKYVQSVEGNTPTSLSIKIRTDIPGHAVIGTASAFRLLGHRYDTLIPYLHRALDMGCNFTITLLVYYSMYTATTIDFSTSGTLNPAFNIPNLSTSRADLNLGDDEVMRLDNISPEFLYSLVHQEWEYLRQDGQEEELYMDRPRYSENILNSFIEHNRTDVFSFRNWLLQRFVPFLPKSSLVSLANSGGFGTQERTLRVPPVTLSSTLGWASQLSYEFRKNGNFLGM